MKKNIPASALIMLALTVAVSGAGLAKKVEFPGRVIRDVVYVQRGLKPLRLDVYQPAGEPMAAPVVMVIHGGGFVGGTRKMMDPLCMTIAKKGIVVFNVEYRLAPAYTFPAPIEDARCALRWIAKHAPEYGGDPSRIGVTGESAGAYLSAMLLFPPPELFSNEPCAEGTPELPAIKAAVLYYGVYDMATAYDSGFPGMHLLTFLALRSKPDRDPELFKKISPITYLHPGLPPILIQVGSEDPLFPESQNLYQRLREMGEPIEMVAYPGAEHAFAVYLDRAPGSVNLDKTAEYFAEHLF